MFARLPLIGVVMLSLPLTAFAQPAAPAKPGEAAKKEKAASTAKTPKAEARPEQAPLPPEHLGLAVATLFGGTTGAAFWTAAAQSEPEKVPE
jgi:hypothetical protein